MELSFCIAIYLTCVHFRGELQHVGDLSEQNNKCRPIRTREVGCVRLLDELYADSPQIYLENHLNICLLYERLCFFNNTFS